MSDLIEITDEQRADGCLLCDGQGRIIRTGSWTATEPCPRCKGSGRDPRPGSYIKGGIIRDPASPEASDDSV